MLLKTFSILQVEGVVVILSIDLICCWEFGFLVCFDLYQICHKYMVLSIFQPLTLYLSLLFYSWKKVIFSKEDLNALAEMLLFENIYIKNNQRTLFLCVFYLFIYSFTHGRYWKANHGNVFPVDFLELFCLCCKQNTAIWVYINSDKLLDLWIVISNLFVDVQLLN